MKKHKNLIIIIVLLAIAGVFFIWGATTSSTVARTWEDTAVACLDNGHQNLAVHIHPALSIVVDGESESIPANVGITPTCMAETHTHDASGDLHVEAVQADRIDVLTLADFFDVWGRDLERDGYELSARVNGEEIDDPAALTFEDHQQIELEYVSSESANATSSADSTHSTSSGQAGSGQASSSQTESGEE